MKKICTSILTVLLASGGLLYAAEATENTYVANCDNANANIPSSGTSCKSVTWDINEGISFNIATQDEGFRSTSKTIKINGKSYNALYMLSTSSTASKTYSLTKTGAINKVTLYAYYNSDGDSEATIYLDPEGDNTPVSIYGMAGELVSVDVTDVDVIKICSNGIMVAFDIEYVGYPVEDPEPELPENVFMITSSDADQNIPSSGTNCKEINWTINEETSFKMSTDEGFRSSTKAIRIDGTNYNPVYFLSTGSGSKIFTITKIGKISNVTMYAYFNNNDNASATIYLNPETDNTPVTLYGYAGELTKVDFMNVESLQVCSGGFMAVFAVELDTTTGVEGLEVEDNVDNAETVYYNLSGVHVENPTKGIYVRIRGEKVDKVVIR